MLDALVDALNATGYPFAHFGWSHAPSGDYGIYSESSGNDLITDELHSERGTDGYIDLFTRDDSETPRVAIEDALNSLRIPWSLISIQYENDSGYIHYQWEFGIYG